MYHKTRVSIASITAILAVLLFSIPALAQNAPFQPLEPGCSDVSGGSGHWIEQVSGTENNLEEIFCLDENHIWAVGAGGTILFNNGSTWSAQASGTDQNLTGVWASDTNHAWAVGDYGTILFFNGTSWSKQASGSTDYLAAVDGCSSEEVWAVGFFDILKFDGNSWTEINPPEDFGPYEDISCHSVDCVWALGRGDGVLYFDGTDWQPIGPDEIGGSSEEIGRLEAVVAIDPENVWISPFHGRLCFYDGSNWSWHTDEQFENHHGDIEANSPTDVWSALLMEMWRYNGSTWEQVGGDFTDWINGFTLAPSGKAWAVSSGGKIHHWPLNTPDPDDPEDEFPCEPSLEWYFAEGSTNGGFETWILVQNPNVKAVNVQLTYMTPGGSIPGPTVSVAAESRTSFNVAESVPDEWEVSTLVLSDRNVVAERSMFWNDRAGGHNSIGVIEPSTAWCLAEGSTNGDFETWIMVQNPNDSTAEVELYYLTPDGIELGQTSLLSPHSRRTFNVADRVPNTWDVSTMVFSDEPVVAERSMYWNERGGGHNSIGSAYISATWFLAEGSTNGGFETWVLVENPNDVDARVELDYLTAEGEVPGPTDTLPPFSRRSYNVADTVPGTWDVSTVVTSDEMVVAERSMYWSGRLGGHNTLGSFLPSRNWYVAEGSTKGGFETWVLVQNPWNENVEIKLTYMTPDGARTGPIVDLEPMSRMSFHVGDGAPEQWEVSTFISAELEVIVEKAIYWGGRVDGGCSTGVPEPEFE